MLKLFKFTCGVDERVGVFADAEDAYDRRETVDPTYFFLPVRIDEITVPGYVITIVPEEAAEVQSEHLPNDLPGDPEAPPASVVPEPVGQPEPEASTQQEAQEPAESSEPDAAIDDQFTDMDRDGIKAWLSLNGIEFSERVGTDRLKDKARAWLAEQAKEG